MIEGDQGGDVAGASPPMGEDEAGTAEAVRGHREAAHPITLGCVDPSRPECARSSRSRAAWRTGHD